MNFYKAAINVCEGGSLLHGANHARAAYIPKKGLARGSFGLQAKPSEARPLMLKNADSKVLCRVLAHSLMPTLGEWCHDSQRGFIRGRTPGLGVLDIDTACRCIALLYALGLLGLFDFAAAFPSLSRTFILEVMAAAGFPLWTILVAASTWFESKVVNERGEVEYAINDGVGQGCPSAAALFVIGINPLLVALSKLRIPGTPEAVSAFADGIAMCVTSPERMRPVHALFLQFQSAAALRLNLQKTVFVPLCSGDADLAAVELRLALAGTPWSHALVDTSAVLIGIPVGPRCCAKAFTYALAKYSARVREIADLGLALHSNIILTRVLATPVLHHVGQFHPLPVGASHKAIIAAQSLMHLPHRGFSDLVLRNLSLVGLPDLGLADLAVKGIALSAARRYGPFSAVCIAMLSRAFADSDLRPIAALARHDPTERDGYTPIGWDGAAFASIVDQNLRTLYALDAQLLKGPALCRALEPICTSREFADELVRRLGLWAPEVHRCTLTSEDFCRFLPALSEANNRDKTAWLRLVQNAWATRGRFNLAYAPCLICGGGVDRLLHIIGCKPFWRPIFTRAGAAGGRGTLRRLLLSPDSAALAGIGFRAHAALRGLPASSALAWAEQVSASF